MSRNTDTVPKNRKEGYETNNLRAQLEEVTRERDHLASQLTIAERETAELRESVFELSLRLSESSSESGPTVFSLTHGFFYSPQDDAESVLSVQLPEEPLKPSEENEEAVSLKGEFSETGSASPTSSVGSAVSLATNTDTIKPLHIGESHLQTVSSRHKSGTVIQQPELSPITSPNKARTSVLEELTTSSKLVLDEADAVMDKTNMLRTTTSNTTISSAHSQSPPVSSMPSNSVANGVAVNGNTSPARFKSMQGTTLDASDTSNNPTMPTQEPKKSTGRAGLSGGMSTNESLSNHRGGSRPALGMTAELRGHQGAVYAVRFSHDGEWLCSGGFDSKVCLWDVKAQTESSQKLNGHTQPVSSVAIEADDCAVVTGSYDKSVRRWDVQTGSEMSRVAVNGMVQAVALGDDFNVVDSSVGNQNTSALAFIGSTDKSLIVADHRVGSIVATWSAPAPITSVYCYSEEGLGGRVLSSDASGCVLIWDCRTGSVLSSHSLNEGGVGEGGGMRRRGGALHVSCLACAPLQTEAYEGARSEGPFAAAVCGDNSLRILERWSGSANSKDLFGSVRARHMLRGPQLRNWPIGAAWWRGLHHKPPRFSVKGTSAAAGSAMASSQNNLDNTDSGSLGGGSSDRVKQLPWSHALVLACGSADGKIHLYDASSMPRSPILPNAGATAADKSTNPSSDNPVSSASLPPGLASSGVPTPVQVLPCRSPGDRTYCVDWHPHEPCLASGSADGIVRLWQPVARQVAKTSNTRTSRPGPPRR